MDYFDLHCDTLYEMEKKKEGFFENSCHVSFDDASRFGRYARIMAIWTRAGLSDDEGFLRYLAIRDHMKSRLSEGVSLCRTYDELECAEKNDAVPIFLAVEGANLLGGDISRLDTLYDDGVRFLTLMWRGETCIGGAYDTSIGLTDFGREVVLRCFDMGITVDLSHASRKTTSEVLCMCGDVGGRVIMSHSNSYSVCAHDRNITDEEAISVARLGGIIGVCFAPEHLSANGADISDIAEHIDHYMSLGLCKSICIGADFDGVGALPRGINGERDIIRLYDMLLCRGYTRELLSRIFWQNACDFIKNM